MIQRVQSIWLFLASVAIFLLLIIPIVSKQEAGVETWIQGSGLYKESNGIKEKIDSSNPLVINIIAVGILCFVAIFTFKNRTLQKRMIWVCMVLIISLSFWIYLFCGVLPGGITMASYGVGAFLPILSFFFCILGLRGIRKDEQLLKSADRLR
ncbi:DUF4293 domain-containing protein [Pedobacter metabolipauper]|uniref:Uncharacterized protein DUF4293 n=1 Tax=Pedobacter metabolipauper TaxID=425513 RepID=A0A4R6SRC4_9SPHI|nr:DUF4293 domain-containing protein [Pedobacter metabolipauper]TDQ07550.1 uncharacterized protein DUF4293 [Pedobacter metabolipauper]